MPKIIGVLGSPIPDGNTALLLKKALEGAKDAGCEVEHIDVTSLNFQSCQEVFYCTDHEACIFNDDLNLLYPAFASLEGLLIATPVMTMGIPGPLKSFIDRFQVFYMAKYFRNKPLVPESLRAVRKGLFISISGMDVPDVFDGAQKTVRAFFKIIDCSYHDELLVRGMDRINDLKTRPDLLDAAYTKGFALGSILAGKSPGNSEGNPESG